MTVPDFVHLHTHSEFSLLDGLGSVQKLLEAAKADGQMALGLTDHGAMYGAMHFYNAALKAGVKPIIGVEAYVAAKSRFDKQTRQGTDQYHLTLLATSHLGYQNLMKLTSIAHLEGFSYKPRIDEEVLFEHAQDIVVTSGCMNSQFNRLLLADKDDQAITLFKKYKQVFAKNFYIELQRHQGVSELDRLNTKLIDISRKLDIDLVATNDVHYPSADDAQAQDALLCVQTRKLISDTNRMSIIDSPDYYLRSRQQMAELFRDYPEALANTVKIAEQVDIQIPRGKLIFPEYPIPDGFNDATYLEHLVQQGLRKKFPEVTQELQDRVAYELDIIKNKGYDTYFLITQDFVTWAKKQGIAVGPGRGSAAGSLVSYALDITSINPILHNMPFERFLNPERPSPPDIDLDFADDRRDEVIKYVMDKYGSDHVAHVITFGRMEARVAIRDIGRVLGLPYEEPDKIAKLIPNPPGKKAGLDEALNQVPELAEYYKQPKFKKLIDLAKKVQGNVRHHSVHAAAVIIADKPLPNYTPIQQDSKSGKTITQYDMYVLDANVSEDALGLLKFDFLGLRNLSIIEKTIQLIKQTIGENIDIENLPLDDEPTYQLLSRGDTMGVFQLESAGMRRVARSLKPSQFSDIAALVALYRPGPMDLIPKFIEGKHQPDKVEYIHPSLKQVLAETYGVMVYQEQVMQIFNVMGGYTLGEADVVRRAIGKKKMKILAQNKIRFIKEAQQRNYSTEVAEQVWAYIEAFANYGFNKAHAASYAMIAYQTAYLKANYPVQYMAALMTVESGSHAMNRDEKVALSIQECKQMGIKVLPPDINKSGSGFKIESAKNSLQNQAIRFGLNAVKNVGTAALDNILETRESNGEFSSFTQFLIKTDSRKVNKKVLESLIKVGAFDSFGTRSSMLEQLDDIRQKATQFQSEVEGQDTLFAGVASQVTQAQDTFETLIEYPQQELLSFEKELLGLYLTDHPLANALNHVQKRASKQIGDLDVSIHNEQTFLFGGIITSLRQVTTKKSGKPMAFGTLEDQTGSMEFVVFPRTFEQYGQLLESDIAVLLKAKVTEREGEVSLIAEKISVPDSSVVAQAEQDNAREIFIPHGTSKQTLEELGALLKQNQGKEKVIVTIPNGTPEPKKLVLPYTVEWSEDLAQKVAKILAG